MSPEPLDPALESDELDTDAQTGTRFRNDFNRIAVRVIRQLVEHAASSEITVAGERILIEPQREPQRPWPDPKAFGLDVGRDGARPDALRIRCRGPNTDRLLRFHEAWGWKYTTVAGERQYGLRTVVDLVDHSVTNLLTNTISTAVGRAADGEQVPFLAYPDVDKRAAAQGLTQDMGRTERVVAVIEASGLPTVIDRGRVNVITGHVRVPDGALLPSPQAVLEKLVSTALLKIPFVLEGAPSYWKVSPGNGADHWEECRDGGFIGIGWSELGDLTGLDRDGFVARMNEALRTYPKWTSAQVEQVWRFMNIPVGGRIVANDGTRRVVGIGTVTGPYYYAGLERLGHRLRVRWDDTREREVERLGWRRTLIQMKRADFEEVVAAPSPDETTPTPEARVEEQAAPPERINFDGIIEQLEEEGLHFPDELVAAYLLALQTKRLVILSGISGTGKTRLAMSIARIFQPRVAATDAPVQDADGLRIRVQPYMLKFRRLVLPATIAPLLRTGDRHPERIQVRFADRQTESLSLSAGATAFQLLFRGEFRKWFEETFAVGDELVLQVEGDDTPSLSLTRADAADRTLQSVSTTTEVVVAVRPDWTDNRGLLGYYNPITRQYQVTPFLRLLLAAHDEQMSADREKRAARPFFVVLDEMNLARVEHYFSDFLSSIESGKALHLHDDPELAEGESESGTPIPCEIVVPRNLFFTGTVNVDESTYMFSPKVLDRAFTLEFNEVDLRNFGSEATETDAPVNGLRLELFDGVLATRHERGSTKHSIHDWMRFRELEAGTLSEAVLAFQDCLEPHHRHFGYRVASEIARFVGLAAEQASRDPAVLWDALDIAVLAKVLPKLHGTQQEIDEVLRQLFACAVDPTNSEPSIDDGWRLRSGKLERASGAAPRLPRTAAKLWRMRERLRKQGFASFIE